MRCLASRGVSGKEGGMRNWQFLPLVLSLLLVSCDNGTSAKEAAIQQEVANRVEVIRGELKVDEDRRRTIRVACFTLLAGGALVLLFRLRPHDRRFRPPPAVRPDLSEDRSVRPMMGGRVIDPPRSPQRRPPV